LPIFGCFTNVGASLSLRRFRAGCEPPFGSGGGTWAALSSAITTPDERMQQKKYKDKKGAWMAAILQYPRRGGQRRRNHHRPENKVQSGNDYIFLVLTPKIIIFLITHFEKRALL
jgi:hypothetical protein